MNQIAISVYSQNAIVESFYTENHEKLQRQITEIMILIQKLIDITTSFSETKTN